MSIGFDVISFSHSSLISEYSQEAIKMFQNSFAVSPLVLEIKLLYGCFALYMNPPELPCNTVSLLKMLHCPIVSTQSFKDTILYVEMYLTQPSTVH